MFLGKERGMWYRGRVNKSKSGRTCQKWSAQSPQKHGNTPAKRPGKGVGAHNFCRNPDGAPTGIYCYTTDPKVRWEVCNPEPVYLLKPGAAAGADAKSFVKADRSWATYLAQAAEDEYEPRRGEVVAIAAESAGDQVGPYARLYHNGARVDVAKNRNKSVRGINVMVLSPRDGAVVASASFDTSSRSDGFDSFIRRSFAGGSPVVAAVNGDAAGKLSPEGRKWFADMGSAEIKNLKKGESFVFLGGYGAKAEVLEKRGGADQEVSIALVLTRLQIQERQAAARKGK